MSASQEPDISDIHAATNVAETLSVSTTESVPHSIGGVSLPNVVPVSPVVPHPGPTALSVTSVTVPSTDAAAQHTIPAVGASISVPGDSASATISDRASTALLNIASSSLNLTEILNAQQQALEQFQCQLQLAQQTEAINQRLDAIERTLNSLIQQKAQEDAAKSQQQQLQVQQQQQQQQQSPAVGVASAQRSQGHPDTTPIRPSQQLQFETPGSDFGSADGKKKKLPRELCSKVRSTYHTVNQEFKIDERFLSPANQRVTDALIDSVYNETNGIYTVKDIKRAAHRYYESRRRLGIEEQPDRQEKAAEQKKRRKYRARQQRSFDRRKKYVRDTESRYWDHMTPACMTEESDSENAEKIVTHELLWRSEFMNQFIQKLDSRYDKARKPGTGSTVKRERVNGLPSTSNPPPGLPSWMIDPTYKIPATTSVCISPPSMEGQDPPTVPEEVTTYTTLIADVQDVHDESSDFELPDTVVA